MLENIHNEVLLISILGMVGEEFRSGFSSYSEREGVQGGSETSDVVRVGDGGADKKTGGGDGGGRVEGVTVLIRIDNIGKIRNAYIRGTAQVGRFGEKTREARLRWCGHVLRKDYEYIGRRLLLMELSGQRKRGRPKRRFMDAVREDMAEVEVTEEDAEDRTE